MECSPTPFVVRPFDRATDMPAFVRLRREIEEVDRSGNDVSEQAAFSTLAWPGHDPARDRWTAWIGADPENMAGYAFTWAQSPERSIVYTAIRPDLRRRGIGSRLMEAALMRSIEVGSTHATSAVGASNDAGSAFLSSRGFTVAGENRFMRAGAEIDALEPVWPTGYSAVDFASVGDLSILAEALNGSYGDMWGHTENSPGIVDAGYLEKEIETRPELHDPHGIFLAFDPEGDVAGIVAAFRKPAGPGRESDLVIDSPGVLPRHRSLGLQKQLTLTAMRWLRKGSTAPIALETFGDSPEAFRIYAGLGFEIEARFIEYCRKLP